MINKIAEVYQKVGTNAETVHKNKEEVYKISRMLPEEEGYELIKLFDSTVNNICEAYKKVVKK